MLSAWPALSPKSLTDPFREFVNRILRPGAKLSLNPRNEWLTIREDSRVSALGAGRFSARENRAGQAAQCGGFADVAKTPPMRRKNSPSLWRRCHSGLRLDRLAVSRGARACRYRQIALPLPGRPRSFHIASTFRTTSSLMRILRPHSRFTSPGHLSVASRPILEPSPETGEAKSR